MEIALQIQDGRWKGETSGMEAVWAYRVLYEGIGLFDELKARS
jgi:hypothetical protein